MHKELDSN